MTRNSIAAVVIGLSAGLLQGCAATGTTTIVAGGYNYSEGDYTGQGILNMTVNTPMYRQLPPESTDGFVSVRNAGGGRVLVVVRFHSRGNQCTLQGSQTNGGFFLDPGQYCRGFITYRDFDIDAVLQITDARGYVSGRSLTMSVQGNVVAQHRDGSQNTGTARWQMSGIQ